MKIGYPDYEKYLADLSKSRSIDIAVIKDKMRNCGTPGTRGTTVCCFFFLTRRHFLPLLFIGEIKVRCTRDTTVGCFAAPFYLIHKQKFNTQRHFLPWLIIRGEKKCTRSTTAFFCPLPFIILFLFNTHIHYGISVFFSPLTFFYEKKYKMRNCGTQAYFLTYSFSLIFLLNLIHKLRNLFSNLVKLN